jgi:DNA-binding beta-propeller fold protein YncE
VGVTRCVANARPRRFGVLAAAALLVAGLALALAGSAGAAEQYDFVAKWGGFGKGNGQFSYPADVATDAAGNVYVADAGNNRIQKFGPSGAFIAARGSFGSANGRFDFPDGVAVDPAGNVYVADAGNDRIQKFSPSGTFITKWGSSGSGNGRFQYPHGLAIDAAGNVYVTDDNDRVQKFTSNGTFITRWGSTGGGNGQFRYAADVATDPAGNVYVTDAGNNRVQKFSSNGAFIRKWGSLGRRDGQFQSPVAIGTDAVGNVYVGDSFSGGGEGKLGQPKPFARIQKFTSSGAFITKWGSYGSANGQFRFPAGIATGPFGDLGSAVYVADASNNRIQKFAPGEAPPPPTPGKTVNVAPVKGTVKTKCKGDTRFTKLTGAKQIPVGCKVDTERGTVRLTSSKGTAGGTQSGKFNGGLFKINQKKTRHPYTVLKLAGSLHCNTAKALSAPAPAAAKKGRGKKRGRRLWGNGKGKFRTRGRHGAASVRGTDWLVEDRCNDSTLFKVRSGVVKVNDFEKRKTVTLRKGERYVARAKR